MTHLKEYEVVNMNLNDAGIIIRYINDGAKVEFWWTDYVANEWSEVYDNLAQAFTRCALLLECEASNWELGFKNIDSAHVIEHNEFVMLNIG